MTSKLCGSAHSTQSKSDNQASTTETPGAVLTSTVALFLLAFSSFFAINKFLLLLSIPPLNAALVASACFFLNNVPISLNRF